MTNDADVLDGLAPADDSWFSDWNDVLRRARTADDTMPRSRRRTIRAGRVAIALVVAAAVLVPLAALGAANDWWFFRGGGAPTPSGAPAVVTGGEWNGHPWQLVAYASTTDGVCFSITPKGSSVEGRGAGMACEPIVGVPRTRATKVRDETITYLSGRATNLLPAYIAGPVVASAERVEVELADGRILRLGTVPAPASVGHIRFYAAKIPSDVAPSSSTTAGPKIPIRKLIGLNAEGDVVACLVAPGGADGMSPRHACE